MPADPETTRELVLHNAEDPAPTQPFTSLTAERQTSRFKARGKLGKRSLAQRWAATYSHGGVLLRDRVQASDPSPVAA